MIKTQFDVEVFLEDRSYRRYYLLSLEEIMLERDERTTRFSLTILLGEDEGIVIEPLNYEDLVYIIRNL